MTLAPPPTGRLISNGQNLPKIENETQSGASFQRCMHLQIQITTRPPPCPSHVMSVVDHVVVQLNESSRPLLWLAVSLWLLLEFLVQWHLAKRHYQCPCQIPCATSRASTSRWTLRGTARMFSRAMVSMIPTLLGLVISHCISINTHPSTDTTLL